MNSKFKQTAKKCIASFVAAATAITMLPTIPVKAEDSVRYPYTLFAGSYAEGAITTTASNFGVNGNVATNGTISAAGNMNINGTKTENAGLDMIYIFDKIDSKYFSGSNVDEHTEDYVLDELNINISNPIEVLGDAELTGNININTALKAFKDVTLNGEVKNTDNSVIYSKYGDIIIDSTNVNLNGLVYAPFGSVEVKAMNLNLNNVVIIADSIVFDCPNVNANYSTNMADFVGTVSEPLDIPKDEWPYMKDENGNGLPDFFEDFENWSKLVDTDGDGLPDSIEEYLGSDPNNIDTDSDGLNDFYEVFNTFTDPTKADTDDNGVNDGDEDFDEDGLTNLEEFENGTDPYVADTDGDGLLDGDEVKNHGTDPLVADTDGDGLDDGDEIVLGTNPLVQDTDGDGIIDSKEKFQQTFTHKVKNEDCAVTEVIVDTECTGNINKTTSVESVMNIDILCTDVVGLIGEPFEIETESEFDKATLTFKINKDKLGEIPFDNLLFLWYNEEGNEFVELETILDEENGTASIVTTHFSRYMIVDKKAWFEAWAVEFNYNPSSDGNHVPGVSYPTIRYNTALTIDCSGSMDWNDPKKQRADAASKFVEYLHSNDKASVVFFTSSAQVVASMTDSKYGLKDSIKKVYSSGGTDFSVAIKKAISTFDVNDIKKLNVNNRIILLSDGEDGGSSAALNAALDDCVDKKIKIFTVGFGSANDTFMQKIADKTGGTFFKAFSADNLVDIFAEIGFTDDFDTLDKDEDKLPDIVESAGIRLQNGQIIYCDPTNPDTDGDGLLDGEEIDPTPVYSVKKDNGILGFKKLIGTNTVEGYYFKMYSNPTKDNSDSDYDGIEDKIEGPDKSLNNLFTVTWDPDVNKNGALYKNITYSMDYSQFFKDNTKFNGKISQVSSLMSALAYNDQCLTDVTDITPNDSYVDQFLRNHGMKEVKTYKLADMYDDQHTTDVTFGHHRVKYDGQIKEIIAVVIRGTNGTVEEWSSNFDIGCDSIFEGTGLIPKNDDWKIKENHMGFDIAATRVINLFKDDYLENVAVNLDPSAKKTLWITGHSRGAAISNIVGSRLDKQYETFVYTFATPRTTTVSEESAKSHKSIFNIINSDDIIADMPLEDKWGFIHYGNDISISVAENHSDEWKNYTTKTYVSNQEEKKELLISFGTLADDRNDCYEFHCSCHGDWRDGQLCTATDGGYLKYGKNYCKNGSFTEWHGNNDVTYYTRCETTAYFMQYLAILAAKANIPTGLTDVAEKYESTKWKFIGYAVNVHPLWIPIATDYIKNPHQPISYYILASR